MPPFTGQGDPDARVIERGGASVEAGGAGAVSLQAVTALREHDEMLTLAFTHARDMMLLARVERGPIFRVQSVNRRYLDVVRAAGFPVAAEQMPGRTFSELQELFPFPDEVWQNILRRYRAVVETKQPIHYDEVTHTPNGVFFGQTTISPVCDDAGVCRFVLYMSNDVTDTRRAEAALRESEAKFATAFRAAPGAMGLSDLASREFVEVNEGYCGMFGYTREEMIGRTALALGLWADQRDRDRFLETMLATGSVPEMEMTGRRRDGALINCLLRAETVNIRGRPHVLTTLFDFTARRRAEQERAELEHRLRQTQKLDALGQLAGGIAHDFNNILTGIGAYTELALWDAENPAAVRANLAHVRRATERATDLVRQILTFSRQQPPARKPLALAAVIEEAVKLVRSTAKAIDVRVHLDRAAPVVLADATQIHQVLMNLCTNAVHAMRDRPGKLVIALERIDTALVAPPGVELEPGVHARITVADTGHGMDAATRARIFEPFFTTKEPGDGTGLGLSVVHRIVQEHDGAVGVRSEPGVGTVFEIYFPLHEGAVDVAGATAMGDFPRGAGERVLVVDDEPAIAHVAGMLLQRLGYQATALSDPEEALRKFEAEPAAIDVLVTDLTMPRISGLELARRVLARRPDLPVVLATGHSGSWTAEGLRGVGITGLLMKPLSAAKLAQALPAALSPMRRASA